ncbi:hypothetical protein VTK56DRAFT_3454 [Thermocarpiscus australiensis]
MQGGPKEWKNERKEPALRVRARTCSRLEQKIRRRESKSAWLAAAKKKKGRLSRLLASTSTKWILKKRGFARMSLEHPAPGIVSSCHNWARLLAVFYHHIRIAGSIRVATSRFSVPDQLSRPAPAPTRRTHRHLHTSWDPSGCANEGLWKKGTWAVPESMLRSQWLETRVQPARIPTGC